MFMTESFCLASSLSGTLQICRWGGGSSSSTWRRGGGNLAVEEMWFITQQSERQTLQSPLLISENRFSTLANPRLGCAVHSHSSEKSELLLWSLSNVASQPSAPSRLTVIIYTHTKRITRFYGHGFLEQHYVFPVKQTAKIYSIKHCWIMGYFLVVCVVTKVQLRPRRAIGKPLQVSSCMEGWFSKGARSVLYQMAVLLKLLKQWMTKQKVQQGQVSPFKYLYDRERSIKQGHSGHWHSSDMESNSY